MKARLFFPLLSVFLFLVVFSSELTAQSTPNLTKLSVPITLDGVLEESEWGEVEYLPLVQYEPVFQGTMNEETRIKVAYDENYLYVAGEMYTKDPSTIATNSLARDKYSSDDVFAIIVDGFNDNQNASWFFTNPDGVRFDFAVSNDAESGGGRSAINSSWNTFWDVETTINDEGWFAEMRIPFSSIGVQVENGVTDIGFIVYRWIANINERHIYPEIPPNWGLGNAKPSQAQDVQLKGIVSKNPLYITPYGLFGNNRSNTLNADSSGYNLDSDIQTELGFDLRYNVTSNLTLDVTVNTDFAQVEADDQQLNLSRFSIFFPEKRQFFQQRSGLFDFPFGRNRVFYSRRIGLDNNGNPVRILGGARLTGRVAGLDIGFLNMQTESTDDLSSENFGVLRLRQQAINETSYIGGIFTSRLGSDGAYNYVMGLDTEINTYKTHFIEFRASQSIDDDLDSDQRYKLDETTSLRVSLRNDSDNGFNYQATYSRFAENYRPEIGFVRIPDVNERFLRLAYGWLSDEQSVFRRHSIRVFYFSRFYNEGGSDLLNFNDGIQDRNIDFQWNGRFKQLGGLNISLRLGKENVPVGDDFNLIGKIRIPSGTYEDYTLRANYQLSDAWKVAGNTNISYGAFYDGDITEYSLNPRFFLSRKLELGGSYRFTHLEFPEIAERTTTDFTTHLVQLRGQYSFDKKATVSAFVQYSNLAELIGANLRFRYNFSEGRDFWLVLNEQINTNLDPREQGLPNAPRIRNGSILIKYNHTFAF